MSNASYTPHPLDALIESLEEGKVDIQGTSKALRERYPLTPDGLTLFSQEKYVLDQFKGKFSLEHYHPQVHSGIEEFFKTYVPRTYAAVAF